MRFIKCDCTHTDEVYSMYERTVKYLVQNINYPKWSKEHPSREYVEEAAKDGRLFACVDEGKILGAVVLSEDPEGCYELGDWKKELNVGEFLCVHILAVDPKYSRRGIGGFMADCIIDFAKKNGYRAIRLDIVPDNLPAKRLYESRGFTSAGCWDLKRNIDFIPIFELYELNFE